MPVEHKVFFSRGSLVRMAEPQLVYTLLDFSRPTGSTEYESPSLNLCLVLDRSTSMQGENMDVVKATAIQIMRKMKPQDFFSVVVFSDRAEVIIPASRNADAGKLEALIHKLYPSGGTEIFSGLEMGFNEVSQNVQNARVNHIVMLTDGHTYGDEEKCTLLARRAAELGIGISGLGIGAEWNDIFLDSLASITGGSSIYVSRPQDIQSSLLEKFNRLGKSYAEETSLEFTLPEGVELRIAFRLQPEVGELPLESPMKLGPIDRDVDLKIVMEFLVQPEILNQDTVIILDGKLGIELTEANVPGKTIPVHLELPVSEQAGTDIPSAEIMDALSRLRLYRLQEQAHLEVTAGEFDKACEHLHRLATHLLAQGERGLAHTVLLEAENILQKKSFSQQGRKEIKYGTRALLTSGKGAEKP